MSKITLNKISKILGISKSTVSKALNNYADVSPVTKKMVLNLAEELNYKPNTFAQNLRSQESRIVGLIVPEIVHYFFFNHNFRSYRNSRSIWLQCYSCAV